MIGFFSPDGRENPFFNCHGFKPVVIEKRFGMTAGIASNKYYYWFKVEDFPLVFVLILRLMRRVQILKVISYS